ncbi:MAG: fluoride efflux transporter CrcB [Proteobacteria bacterium]|nr:fluoride efflux transporter CrcB [Pseudomonadota bacterium]
MTYASAAAGGAIGTMARLGFGDAVASLVGATFPWGTLLINILGSIVIGWFDGLTGSADSLALPPEIRAFVMVGLCGGFTTFSAFSLQTLQLAEGGEMLRAAAYVIVSVVLCLLGVWAGAILGRA